MGITIREMIEQLEEMAKIHGDDKPVCTYDSYLANEGWDYEEKDLYMKPRVLLDTDMDVILIR